MSDQKKFRIIGINKIKYYFNSEIQERKLMSKTLRKYIAALIILNKTLIVLSATSGHISIISFKSVIGVPLGITSASFSLVLSLITRIIKKTVKDNKKQKEEN